MRICIWVMGIWLFTGGVVSAETVDFTLNPPLDKPLRVVTSRRISAPAKDPSGALAYSLVVDNEFHLMITEKDGQRWMISRLEKNSVEINGELVDAPLGPAMLGLPISRAFDHRGQLGEVRGLEAIVEKLRAAGISPGFIADIPQRNERAWDSFYGRMWGTLAGRSIAVGSSWEANETLLVGNPNPPLGMVPIEGSWTLVGREAAGSDRRVRLRYEAASGVVPLEGTAAKDIEDWVLLWVPEFSGQSWSSFSFRKQGELLIDPATLLEGTRWSDRWLVTLNPEAASSRSLKVLIHLVREWSD